MTPDKGRHVICPSNYGVKQSKILRISFVRPQHFLTLHTAIYEKLPKLLAWWAPLAEKIEKFSGRDNPDTAKRLEVLKMFFVAGDQKLRLGG